MRICLFEDAGSANLEPLALTHPVFDLLCGIDSLRAKQSRFFAPCDVGVQVRPHLADLYRQQHPRLRVNDTTWLRAAPTVMVNGRWLPPDDAVPELAGPCVALAGGEVAYAVLGADRLTYCSPHTVDDCLETWKNTLAPRSAGGRVIKHLWELVDRNGDQIALDCRHQFPANRRQDCPASVVGPEDGLRVDPTAHLDPMVVADTRDGPVVVDAGAVVHAFSRLEGPCYIGPRTQVLGAKIRAGTTLGPDCRIGGEIEASIVHGHSNKYHEGFLGHSYVGEWVNLGAGTHNSDLRNDYGKVSVTVDGRVVSTGLHKVGCFIGDHTKAGLGTLLNTGTSIGVCCNLLPSGGLLPKYVPSFCSWWNGAIVDRTRLPQVDEVAAQVMRRRGAAFTEAHAAVLRFVHEQTAGERMRLSREAELRPLRQSA